MEEQLVKWIQDEIFLDIEASFNLLFVSKNIYTATLKLLSKFWDLLDLVFAKNYKLNLYELSLLNYNKHLFNGHSAWYILSIYYINEDIEPDMLLLDKTIKCKYLQCFPSCHSGNLQPYEVLAINPDSGISMNYYMTKNILYLIGSENINVMILPVLIFNMPCIDTFISRICELNNTTMFRQFYWTIKEYSSIYGKRYFDIWTKLINHMDHDKISKLEQVYCTFARFRNILAYDESIDLNSLKPEVDILNNSGLFFTEDDTIASIHATNDTPTQLRISTTNNRIIYCLSEGCLEAYTLTKCMAWIAYKCKLELEIPDVILSGVSSGFMWLPENSVSFSNLYPDIEDINDIAVHITVHYMLGIDNSSIMVTPKGIVHINYRNLYSRETDIIPLDNLLLKIGGRNNIMYQRFHQTSICTFLYVRRYYMHIMLFLKIMQIRPILVKQRFRYGLNNTDADESFSQLLDDSAKVSSGIWRFIGY